MKESKATEQKAKLFSLYFGQEVFKCEEYPNETVNIVALSFPQIKYGYLSLFDIASLSDEQLITVARMDKKNRWNETDEDAPRTKNGLRTLGLGICLCKNYCWEGYQYLLSQSIALDFYCSIEHRVISVSEQIEKGFIKIRQ